MTISIICPFGIDGGRVPTTLNCRWFSHQLAFVVMFPDNCDAVNQNQALHAKKGF